MFIMDYVAFSLGFIILLLSFSSQSVPASHIVLLHTKAAATSQTLKLTSKCYLFELNILILKVNLNVPEIFEFTLKDSLICTSYLNCQERRFRI